MLYKLKSTARRALPFGAAAALVLATFAPAVTVSADALNPLTDRSLTLSSSSPGWSYTDGSGNTTYAPPNSGANGQKTGNTFSFKVSTDTTGAGDELTAITFQYCTTSAGDCLAPGNNGWSGTSPSMTRNADSVENEQSDLRIATATPTEIGSDTSGVFADFVDSGTGNVTAIPNADDTEGNFVVYWNNSGTWEQSTGWSMTTANNETGTVGDGTATGRDNYTLLTNSTGQGFASGTEVKIVFFGTNGNYITNPGAGEYFVKINTYDNFTAGPPPTVSENDLVDGGVTVANVVNQSIQITTKVLETMDFSVGTVDPLTLDSTELQASSLGKATHGVCDPILMGMTTAETDNVLQLGDQNAESSLSTSETYSTHSYWRLSSNSSAGATVYYSGVTLSNTVDDEIAPIGTTPAAPAEGSEQFGLALAHGTTGNFDVNYDAEDTISGSIFENGDDNDQAGVDPSVGTDLSGNASYHAPWLFPLSPAAAYDLGAGVVNAEYGPNQLASDINTEFAFDANSNKIPAVLAQGTEVVDCVTAKVRYIANIAATTPAGIYTTKINYIAAPQY